jgi:hypothetical protein
MAREVEERRRRGKMEVGSKEWKGPSKKRKYLKKVEGSELAYI